MTLNEKRIAKITEDLTAEEIAYFHGNVRTLHGNLQWKRLVKGNSKIHKDVLCFSLAPIKSCLNCKTCASTCYAVKAYRQYKDTRHAWDLNLELAKNHLALLESMLKVQLNMAKKNGKGKELIVRIHVSGDFVNQEYLDMWKGIAREYQDIHFYTYTKVMNILDFSNLPENLNVIDSFINGHALNYGEAEYVTQLVEKHGAFVCPATDYNEVQCMHDCKYCLTGKKPCFEIH